MKKQIAAILTLTLMMTACGDEGGETTPESTDSTTTEISTQEDSLVVEEEYILPDDRPVMDWELGLEEGTYSERFFRELFAHDFSQEYDFGFRFISANYEDVEAGLQHCGNRIRFKGIRGKCFCCSHDERWKWRR